MGLSRASRLPRTSCLAERQGSRVTFKRLSSDAAPHVPAKEDAERTTGHDGHKKLASRKKSRKEVAQLRKVFDAWREYTVRKATGHTGRKWQNNEDGEPQPAVKPAMLTDSQIFSVTVSEYALPLTIESHGGASHQCSAVYY